MKKKHQFEPWITSVDGGLDLVACSQDSQELWATIGLKKGTVLCKVKQHKQVHEKARPWQAVKCTQFCAEFLLPTKFLRYFFLSVRWHNPTEGKKQILSAKNMLLVF